MKTLSEVLGKPILFHIVLFQGKDGLASSPTGYLSNDPNVIGDQLSDIQNVGGSGCGVIALTYGPTVSPFMHGAAMEMCRQCAEREMPFALCYDPWTVKSSTNWTSAMIAALKHPDTQTMMASRTYISSINGLTGKLVLDFDLGVDAKAVTAAVPGLVYWQKDVDYSWPKIPGPTNNNTKLPCLARQFNDGTGPDRNKQAWDQTQPARIIPAKAGSYYRSLLSTANKAAQFYQMVTQNDDKEGTEIESFMAMFRPV